MIPPEFIQLGPLRLYFYSLTFGGAVWVAYAIALRQGKRLEISAHRIGDIIMLSFISGLIGARLVYVLQNLDYFSYRWSEIFNLTTGGLSIHGGLIVGGLALYLYARRQQIPFLKLTDTLALPLLAGQLIGRLGNWFNQELYGYPTQLPWAIPIDPEHRLPGYEQFSTFHPTFLYEMIFNGIGLLILSRLSFKKAGQLTAGYLVIFAVGRFLAEIWRISDRIIGPLSLAQIVSLVILIGALIYLGLTHNILKKR